MRLVCWVLFGCSVILFLISVYSKFAGPGSYVLGYAAISWWRASLALVAYAIAFKMLHAGSERGT